jgi:two-component system, NtrC family, response regulator HydG
MRSFIEGSSPQMTGLIAAARRVAATDCAILIVGERGSGRGTLAREIHRLSNRSSGLIAEAAASTLPVDNELQAAVEALIADARHGTVLLRGIEHLSHHAQRILIDRRAAAGALASGARNSDGDARLISTSMLEVPRLIGCGSFGAYFFEIMDPVVLRVPSLRERPEDIAPLACEFLQREAERIGIPAPVFSPGALVALASNRWLGNVTELRETVVRLLHDSPKAVIDAGELGRLTIGESAREGLSTLAERNRRYTIEVLERTGGNKSRAAALLGITRQTLYQRLRAYGVIDDYARRDRD